jgi:DNA-binding transcriptional MerR regulator/methylmalonyl-CoA mutase cobalamin-binding subunit
MNTPDKPGSAIPARLSIGALSRATGIPVETLRTWENRYGFPAAERKASGHRLYDPAAVPRLRRVAELLAHGHRAGEVVAASEEALATLLASRAPVSTPSRHADAPAPWSEASAEVDWLALVERFDAERLTAALMSAAGRLGPLEFLDTRVAPLLCTVGTAWAAGQLEIRHEHFLSERLADVLRALRLPFDARATGPLVVLCSLPGEQHTLGLQMAALCLAAADCRLLYLGAETPVAEMVAVARERDAQALGLSISSVTAALARPQVHALRARLPGHVTLLLGGAGAPAEVAGVECLATLRELDTWARRAERTRP